MLTVMSSPSKSKPPVSSSTSIERSWGGSSSFNSSQLPPISARGFVSSLSRGHSVRRSGSGIGRGTMDVHNPGTLDVRNRQKWLNIDQASAVNRHNRGSMVGTDINQQRGISSFYAQRYRGSHFSKSLSIEGHQQTGNKIRTQTTSKMLSTEGSFTSFRSAPWKSQPQIFNYESVSTSKENSVFKSSSIPAGNGKIPVDEVGFGWLIGTNSILNPILPVLPRLDPPNKAKQ